MAKERAEARSCGVSYKPVETLEDECLANTKRFSGFFFTIFLLNSETVRTKDEKKKRSIGWSVEILGDLKSIYFKREKCILCIGVSEQEEEIVNCGLMRLITAPFCIFSFLVCVV